MSRPPTVMPATGAVYTCPMHPEIVRDAPRTCPICGMALEPRTVSAAPEEDNAELRDMTRRFWISLGLSLPLLAFAMSDMLPSSPLRHIASARAIAWLQLVLATPVVLWGGWPFFERAWTSVVNRSLNMFTLIALGTGAAWIYSVVATVAPRLFPDSFRAHGGAVGLYFEAAAVITVLVLLGQVLELRARSQMSGHSTMGPGMMGGGQPSDPKMMAQMMEMRGEMMKAMGDIMLKHARRMQGKSPAPK